MEDIKEKTADEMEDEELEEFFMYLKVASEVVKEKGKYYEFECPICKGKATSIRNTYNGHLWSKCESCDMLVIQ